MRRIGRRDALSYALERPNLRLYAVVALGWVLVFAFEARELLGVFGLLLPPYLFRTAVGAVDLAVTALGGLLMLSGVAAVVYRAVARGTG